MQSDGKSFWVDLVLGSSYIESRDEDSILDQIYEKQIFSVLFHEDRNSIIKNPNIFDFYKFGLKYCPYP